MRKASISRDFKADKLNSVGVGDANVTASWYADIMSEANLRKINIKDSGEKSREKQRYFEIGKNRAFFKASFGLSGILDPPLLFTFDS